jgi:putative membrane protein
MTIRLLMAGVAAGLIVSSPTFAQDKASQKFLKEAIEGNLAEVQLGELAQKNGGSDRVRSFGQMLQKDHSAANEKAKPAANSLGMSPPSEPNSKQKAMYDRMSKLSGENFDRQLPKTWSKTTRKISRSTKRKPRRTMPAARMPRKRCLPCASILRRRSRLTAQPRPESAEV